MKKNGFTLIELLAVIVILAIIAVIAVPIVINIIDDSKENAMLRSTEMYMEAVNQGIARKQLTQNVKSGAYEIMEDGNLCYITNSDCTQENKIVVEVKGETPKNGTIIIDEGEVKDLNTRDVANVDGLVFAEGVISSKKVDPTTGENTFILKIRFNENIGNVSVNNIMSMLVYDPEKYIYKKYYYGKWGGSDYTLGYYSDNVLSVLSTEEEDIIVGEETTYIGYLFSTDDLDSVNESDFIYYIKIGNTEQENVPVQQKANTSMKILNYIDDFKNYYVAKSGSLYDYTPGDMNNDHYIDGKDSLILRQYLLGKETRACKAMDVNGDGLININDLVRLKKFISRYEAPQLEYSIMTDVLGHL